MSRRGIRLIPKTKEPIAPFLDFTKQRGRWQLEGATFRDPEKRESGEITYLELASDTYIVLRDDLLVGLHYFTIWGPAERELADQLRAKIESYSEDELLAWWDRAAASGDVDDKVDAVLFIGVGAPSTPAEPYITRLRAGLADPDVDVRNAAIVGVG